MKLLKKCLAREIGIGLEDLNPCNDEVLKDFSALFQEFDLPGKELWIIL